MSSNDWNGLPTDQAQRGYHWLVDPDGNELPCLWLSDQCMWQIWGREEMYPPTCVALAFRYGAEIVTLEWYRKLTLAVMASAGEKGN